MLQSKRIFTVWVKILVLFLIGFYFHSQANFAVNAAVVPKTNCTVTFAWVDYSYQRKIFYGSWDGTYTVFLFPQGTTRDQYVARKQTKDSKVSFENLQPDVKYIAEVFITGAFLEGKQPYLDRFKLRGCQIKETVSTVSDQSGRVAAVEQSDDGADKLRTLPETGSNLVFSLLPVLFSGLIFQKLKNKQLSKQTQVKSPLQTKFSLARK